MNIVRDWTTRNFRGQPVSLLGGPALAAVVTAAAGRPRTPVLIAVSGAVIAGRYDDVAGARPEQSRDKGFRGHLAALRAGRLTSGTVKVIAIGSTAVLAAAVQQPAAGGRRQPVDVLVDGLLIAVSANVVNLLDLRPGRALKAVLLPAGVGLVASSDAVERRRWAALTLGAGVVLPFDLAERTMLGDAGANAAGAVLGLALGAGRSRRARLGALALLGALTATSERVSFSAVIERTSALRWLDRLGRRG